MKHLAPAALVLITVVSLVMMLVVAAGVVWSACISH